MCHMHYWRLRKHGDVHHTKQFVRKKCLIDDCERWSRKRGWCTMHYSRWLSNGNPLVVRINHEYHGSTKSPEYQSWRAMKERCTNTRHPSYKRYGGRGIKICSEWTRSFQRFYDDLGPRPGESYSLDRIDPNGNYEPDNCRWATSSQQSINTNLYANNSTGYRGVAVYKKKWLAYINCQGQRFSLGYYSRIDDAAVAYDIAAIQLHGNDAKLNILSS